MTSIIHALSAFFNINRRKASGSTARIEWYTDSDGEEVLYLRGKVANNEDIEQIKSILGSRKGRERIRKLIIMFCHISDQHLLSLAANSGDGTMLDRLTEIQLGSNVIGERGAIGLGTFMATQSSSLKTLSLGSNQLFCKGAAALAKSICFSSLTHLDLSANLIQNEGAIAVSNAIEQCLSLVSVNLEGNHISDEGVASLAHAVSINCRIRVLNLAYNVRISDASYGVLSRSIIGHPSMREISLEGTEVATYYRALLRRQFIGLHSERANLMTTLLSTRLVPRLRSNLGKETLSTLSPELIRYLGEFLFDPKLNGVIAKPKPMNNVLSLDKIALFILVQCLLFLWAIIGILVAHWI
jgi:hypothetical protein